MAKIGNNKLTLNKKGKLEGQPVVYWIHILFKLGSRAHMIIKNMDKLVFFLYSKTLR